MKEKSLTREHQFDWFRVDVNSKNKTEIGGIGDEKIYGYTGKIKILLGDDSFWIRCVFVEIWKCGCDSLRKTLTPN